MPYDISFALTVVKKIAKGIEPDFEMTPQGEALYKQLVQYFHGDSDYNGDLTKGILLMGPTGTGKTLAMKVMSVYQRIDNIKFMMENKTYTMNYDVINVNDIVNRFIDSAFDGIQIYANRYVTCLDDLGTEIEEVKHYGNSLDVLGHILTERYSKRLLTFGTTNLPISELEKRYGDRVVSRMHSLFNFMILKDTDFRKLKKTA